MKKDKSIPIVDILNYQDNIYEMTNAAIKRSNQLMKTGNEELKVFHNKPISLALDELLKGRVSFRYKYK